LTERGRPSPLDYSDIYDPESDFDRWYTRAALEVILPLVRPGDEILELGCAKGTMTAALAAAGASVVAVDKSPVYLELARARDIPNVTWIQADLDEWVAATSAFHHIVTTNVLHEVSDPGRLLRQGAGGLRPGGVLHVSLNNPDSVHRAVGQQMGLISHSRDLGPRAERLGAHALFGAQEVVDMATSAGLTCLFQRALMLKPLPNDLMAELPPLLDALTKVAWRYPHIGALNYFALVRAGQDLEYP